MSGRGKVLVCRCEDVTLADVEHSIERGYADMEEIKRYTGFGTGPCQGKECLGVVAMLLAARAAQPDSVRPFTSRQPIAPTPLKHFAALAAASPGPAHDDHDGDDAGDGASGAGQTAATRGGDGASGAGQTAATRGGDEHDA